MAKIRFNMDEHVANAVTKGLRRRGVHVIIPKEEEMLDHIEYL
jgi:hypothetical protein